MKKNAYRLVIPLWAFTLFVTALAAQTTPFARPGLSIGAYHFNLFDGTSNQTLRYLRDTTVCGEEVLVYAYGWSNTLFLRISGGKVSVRNPSNLCNDLNLLYDFDLSTGSTFGTNLKVVETKMVPLLTGEMRRYLKLQFISGSSTVEWVEGIGDIERGMIPLPDFEGYDRLVCVRDSTGDLWYHPEATPVLCDSLLCPLPSPDFKYVFKNQAVEFINLSTNATEWLWDFGDGTFSTEKNPTHEYAATGCYDVSLSIRTSCLQRSFQVSKSVNAGGELRWRKLPFPLIPSTSRLMDIDFVHPDTGWVLSSNSIWRTNDGGEHWEEQTLPLAPAPSVRQYLSLDMLDARHGIIACGIYDYGTPHPQKSNILATQDGGSTWSEHNQGGSNAYLLKSLFAENGKAYAVGQYSGWLRSTDYGQTWEKKDLPPLVNLYALAHIGGDTVCAFGTRGIQPQVTTVFAKSVNAGDSWDIKQLPQYIEQGSVFFTDAQHGWAGRGLGMMLRTTDGGNAWEKYPFSAWGSVTSIKFADSKNGWAVGTNGLVLHTTDGGASWSRENCGYPSTLWSLATPSADIAYAVTDLREVLRYCGNDCSPSSSDDDIQNVDNQAVFYPNPASASVRVGTTYLSADYLIAYNLIGQKVFETEWSTSDNGQKIDVSEWPTGFYSIHLLSGRKLLSQGRVVVLR